MPVTSAPPAKGVFDAPEDDDDEEWQDMPVVKEDEFGGGLDEEDQKKYHYRPSTTSAKTTANATGNLIDVDERGNEWRSKVDQNESEYTRLRVNEEDDADDVHLRTKYLFDEDKAMTPLSQMQATKNLLTEAQRIAYVGLCSLTAREMAHQLRLVKRKELKAAAESTDLWALKIMGRLYYHMEIATQEQKMIESLGEHGVRPEDLVPSLMTTHTVDNPEYDPEEAKRRQREEAEADDRKEPTPPPPAYEPPLSPSKLSTHASSTDASQQTTARVLEQTSTSALAGVSTTLSAADEKVTLDIRWTVLCDLFLVLIADSVFDARSRVLLENVALKLGLGWLDVVKFESRVTEALEIQEDIETTENQEVIDGRIKKNKRKRYMMLGLATLGGGLVIGLSAGLLAPVIGGGLGVALGTIGVTGTTSFLAGAGGAAVITTTGALTGSGIAARGMVNRTRQVQTFNLLPLHNNKRVNCILTVPGFLNGALDDPRLPFSVLDPIVGDLFSVLWEPEMIRETGGALKILTGEVLTQLGQTVLSATVMAALMSALQWPIILTKLGYLIDNPWNNALDRARAAGGVLADVLIQRHLGVRPITLIGFSLGARVIWYALLELARKKAFGIVQDVFLLGTTLSASTKLWIETRSVVSGRYVNAFARNDWVLNYLFRATSAGVQTVAGLRPVEGVPGLENVEVTDKIAGHMSYRTFMPLILDQLGFPVFADYFDEPEEPDFEEDRVVEREAEGPKKRGWFSSKDKPTNPPPRPPPSYQKSDLSVPAEKGERSSVEEDDLPPREASSSPAPTSAKSAALDIPTSPHPRQEPEQPSTPVVPVKAGFDFAAMKEVIGNTDKHPEERVVLEQPVGSPVPPSANRTVSLPSISVPPLSSSPHPVPTLDSNSTLTPRMSKALSLEPEPSVSWQPPSLPSASTSSLSTYASPSTLSFGGSDGTLWAEPQGSDPFSTPYSATSAPSTFSRNPFAPAPASARPTNPFAMSPSADPFASPSGLAFGGADGLISSLPSSNPDPWAMPSFGQKKKSTLDLNANANPWS